MSSDAKAFPVHKTDEEWRRTLTPEQYYVLREHGTERPGTCALLREMARMRPATMSGLLGVKGVGARKAEDLGEMFLEVIRADR